MIGERIDQLRAKLRQVEEEASQLEREVQDADAELGAVDEPRAASRVGLHRMELGLRLGNLENRVDAAERALDGIDDDPPPVPLHGTEADVDALIRNRGWAA